MVAWLVPWQFQDFITFGLMRIWFWIHCFTTKCSQFKRRNRWSRGCFWINSQHRCSKWFHKIVTKEIRWFSVRKLDKNSMSKLALVKTSFIYLLGCPEASKTFWLPSISRISIHSLLVAILYLAVNDAILNLNICISELAVIIFVTWWSCPWKSISSHGFVSLRAGDQGEADEEIAWYGTQLRKVDTG